MTISRNSFPDLIHDLHFSTPRYSGMHVTSREVQLLPLLEKLHIDRFLLLLSALLCERRVLFVADGNDTLSGTILAAISMINPFHWQHILIPLLPVKLLDYLTAPVPYIIGNI